MTGVLKPLFLSTSDSSFDVQFKDRLHWTDSMDAAITQAVDSILKDVVQRGDAAVLEYTQRFDGIKAASVPELEISQAELCAAYESIPDDQRHALRFAADRIRAYHEEQKKACGLSWSYVDDLGNQLGQKVTPLDKVGIYVPGGKAAYPSSVLMNAIPAHVAGVPEIVMVVPAPHGVKNPLVLAAAYLAGVSRAFTVGGAQAVAALAYGTQSIPSVDKITGPGNAYVAEAKRRVFGKVGIDMIAGPSEILVVADGTAPAGWVAMDLFSQAEHDELAQSILLSPDVDYINRVHQEMERLLPSLPRAEIITQSINHRGLLVRTQSMEEACELANRVAPEHLEIASTHPLRWEPLLRHAGAIFLGIYACESLGDYVAGPNHVLPTSGTAKFSNPLGVYDFQKRTSLLNIHETASKTMALSTNVLALGEGLEAHARSATLRLAPQQKD